ncbi:hypothetical protein MRX96_011687 [Rhipicephalus microplus]
MEAKSIMSRFGLRAKYSSVLLKKEIKSYVAPPLTSIFAPIGETSSKDEREARKNAGPSSQDQEPGPKAPTTGQGERPRNPGDRKKKSNNRRGSERSVRPPFEGSAVPALAAEAAMLRTRLKEGVEASHRPTDVGLKTVISVRDT